MTTHASYPVHAIGGQGPAVRQESAQTSGGRSGIRVLPILGLAALGLVVLGAIYWGPDLARY